MITLISCERGKNQVAAFVAKFYGDQTSESVSKRGIDGICYGSWECWSIEEQPFLVKS